MAAEAMDARRPPRVRLARRLRVSASSLHDAHRTCMRRREFLLATGALAWAGQLRAFAERVHTAAGAELWDIVRAAFLVPRDRIYLNVGTLGVQPRVVLDAVLEHTRRVAMSYPPGVQWDTLKQHVAELLHGDAAGFIFPRNTT